MKMAEGLPILRRNRPGTKSADFHNWPEEAFEEMDSTLAVQQGCAVGEASEALASG